MRSSRASSSIKPAATRSSTSAGLSVLIIFAATRYLLVCRARYPTYSLEKIMSIQRLARQNLMLQQVEIQGTPECGHASKRLRFIVSAPRSLVSEALIRTPGRWTEHTKSSSGPNHDPRPRSKPANGGKSSERGGQE